MSKQIEPSIAPGYKLSRVANVLDQSVRNVRRLIASGQLKAYRLSENNVIVLEPDLRQFLAEREMKVAA